jgi:hypothetical protein
MGEAADGGNGLRVRKISAVKGQAQCTPMTRQYKGELIALQRTVVVTACNRNEPGLQSARFWDHIQCLYRPPQDHILVLGHL